MKTLVLGGTGAVGTAAVEALRERGHEVLVAGRRAVAQGIVLDAATRTGLSRLAEVSRWADVVLDLSGLERAEVQRAAGTTPLVDVSASSTHLEHLAMHVPRGGAVLLGAGIAPGVSTVLARALGPAPGDEVDIGVMLGAGEAHGAAAVRWTTGLAGTPVHCAPESWPVMNLRSVRRLPSPSGADRWFLRADFPDDLLVGRSTGASVRSWLALDSRMATWALRAVGAVPALAPALSRAPHIGADAWSVTATHRGSGRTLSASGRGQSRATGRIAAVAAERLVDRGLRGAITMDALIGPGELAALEGLRLTGA
ncbi:NAD-dependent epimerase/dehydratase family protein [Leucobacter chromiiresistens]|uniref:NAD-dependent epimerase/dehydratase domain-containing protein n=1 Tax=Leucobacter chromiiresistens TaxID=1079994 RepID=A0A147EPP9_9MICO|nr:NAD-dependent epimerase/dehydratase family protein [Leucobacter chromiiresistens]KTR86355.1 hypothetical protein NS354_05380 [Leucobacter chromiiresistens]